MSSIPATPAAQPAPSAKNAARASARPAVFSPLMAIIRKELTENLKWVVASLLLQSIVVSIYLWNAFADINFGALRPDNALFDQGMQTICVAFSIGTAVFLAGFQIFTERTFDLRAFFRHRAISPSRLFLGKAAAGLMIYGLCIGLPILLFIFWSATSPRAGVIFDIRFAEPYLIFFLCGIAYYFAALLVAVREARWYMSRTLPFAAAILASICTFACSSFSAALLGVLAVDVALALAAWNAYVHSGVDITLGQLPIAAPKLPRDLAPLALLRKFSLPALILAALTVLSCLLIFLNAEIFYLAGPNWEAADTYGEIHFSTYILLPDGAPAIFSGISRRSPGQANWTSERNYSDLTGNPIPTAATDHGENITTEQFTTNSQVPLPSYIEPTSKLALCATGADSHSPADTPPGRWYYVKPWRLFVGYDPSTGKRIGTVGASGYSAEVAQPFPASALWNDENSVLLVNNQGLKFTFIHPFNGDAPFYSTYAAFAVPLGQTIRQVISRQQESVLVAQGTGIHLDTILITDENFHLNFARAAYQSPATQPYTAQIPIEHALDQYQAKITYYPQTDRVAIRYAIPDTEFQHAAQYVSTYTSKGQPIAHFTLPPLPPEPLPTPRPAEKNALFAVGLVDAFRNPWISSRFPLDTHETRDGPFGTGSTLPLFIYQIAGNSSISALYYSGLFLPILLASALTLFLTTRYRFTLLGKILWTLATLAFGPLALLTLLFTQPLPARIPCPACKQKRLTTQSLCPHCQTPFPPPAPTGNEIFA